jgi:alpha-galactosidase
MNEWVRRGLFCTFILAVRLAADAQSSPTPFVSTGDTQARDQWVQASLTDPAKALPFSFTYDGKSSADLLPGWASQPTTHPLDANRTETDFTWSDLQTGLEVRCVVVQYRDYPAVEWTTYLKNTGSQDTPLLENIQGLDTTFHRGQGSEFVLNGIKGDWCNLESYEPYRLELGPGVSKLFAPSDNLGKSCSGPDGWPYFNLQTPGGGVLMAVGWPGQWAATFARDAADGLHITAGQQLTHLVLHPGEEIRTPLIELIFWKGNDVASAQNLWRRWYTDHNMPRLNGRTQQPLAQIQVSATDDNIAYVDSFLKAGIKPDLCWCDAGWYVNSGNPHKGDGEWLNTGTWEPDPVRYPHGFKPFSDWVHAHGMQFILWFEPERVGDPNSWLGKNHPEWLLANDTGTGANLDEGNPDAMKWLIDHIDGMIKAQGIDWYREDMNGVGPLPAWQKHDAPDRQGMTENLYIQGHLAYWDELLRRNPNLHIDSCASGGRRNDIESMRRAVPLLRSDFQFPNMANVVEGNQGQTYGLSSWLPFYGTGVYSYDPYIYRSFYCPSFGMGGLAPENAAAQKKAYGECGRLGPMMLGDYYPLSSYSLASDAWIAWQFNRPESGDGFVQAFRRKANKDGTQTYRLNGLDPAVQYEVTNFDVDGSTTMSGRDLMTKGLVVPIPGAPGSAILVYKKR